MDTIVLKPLRHRTQECIGIYFQRNAVIQSLIQKHAEGRWSKTNSCWYIPLSKNNYQRFAKTLVGKAVLHIDDLKRYLLEKKKDSALSTIQDKSGPVSEGRKIPVKNAGQIQQTKLVHEISKENKKALQKFKQQLVLKSYSPSTVRTYTNEFAQFLNTIKQKPASEFTTERIKDYMQYCFQKLKLSENTLHSKINTLKFYYEQVLGREKFFWEIPRPKKHLICLKYSEKKNLGNYLKQRVI